MLEASLEAGFSAAGVDVCLVGPIPTPAVAYLTRALRLQAGIVISASHNPFYDNGIKFFSAQGTKLEDALEAKIEAGIESSLVCVPSAELGRARRIDDAAGRYIEFCKSTFPNALDLRGLKIVVDCAHGAAYNIAPVSYTHLDVYKRQQQGLHHGSRDQLDLVDRNNTATDQGWRRLRVRYCARPEIAA